MKRVITILFLLFSLFTYGQSTHHFYIQGENGYHATIDISIDLVVKPNSSNCRYGFLGNIVYNYAVNIYKDGVLQPYYPFYNFQFYFILANGTSIYGGVNIRPGGDPLIGSGISSNAWFQNPNRIPCDEITYDDIDLSFLDISLNAKDFPSQTVRFDLNDPLPIELISFTVENKDYGNLLKWSTATETNNDYFIIEHSVDMTMFSELAVIDGSGHSTSVCDYGYVDRKPKRSNYYRIKQVDYNGDFSYSKVIYTENLKCFDIYPNPVFDVLTIVHHKDTVYVEIFDVNLNLVWFEILESGNVLSVSELKVGLYFILIDNEPRTFIKL